MDTLCFFEGGILSFVVVDAEVEGEERAEEGVELGFDSLREGELVAELLSLSCCSFAFCAFHCAKRSILCFFFSSAVRAFGGEVLEGVFTGSGVFLLLLSALATNTVVSAGFGTPAVGIEDGDGAAASGAGATGVDLLGGGLWLRTDERRRESRLRRSSWS